MQTNNKQIHDMTNVFYELNAFVEKYFSRDLCLQLTFRTFEHKYIDFIQYVWASADGQIKS